MRFQDGCAKDLTLNKLTIVTEENSPMDYKPKVPTVEVIPENTVDLDKG